MIFFTYKQGTFLLHDTHYRGMENFVWLEESSWRRKHLVIEAANLLIY